MLQDSQDPLSNAKVWLLSDGRPGHENQSKGILQALGIKEYKIQTLKFKKCARFLSFLGPKWTFKALPPAPYPDVIIGCGSHISKVSAYIKRRSPTTFVIHLMNVPQNPHLFNVIAAPEHDAPPQNIPHLITTLGAPNNITPKRLKTEAERWTSRLTHLPKPYTAVLVGGTSKHFMFDAQKAQIFADTLVNYTQKNPSSLLILTSRRTNPKVTQIISDTLNHHQTPHFLFAGESTKKADNPYSACLGLATHTIVTADSISMISESASTNASTLVWGQDFIQAKKFKRFYHTLQSQGYIQDIASFNPNQKSSTLNEASRVAGFIRSQYTQWKMK